VLLSVSGVTAGNNDWNREGYLPLPIYHNRDGQGRMPNCVRRSMLELGGAATLLKALLSSKPISRVNNLPLQHDLWVPSKLSVPFPFYDAVW
jgi:hypothetical protein